MKPVSAVLLTLAGLFALMLCVGSASAGKDANLLRAEAFVDTQCPALDRGIATNLWIAGWRYNVLYGNCAAGDGHDQHVWFFSKGRFIGADTREPDSSKEITGVWRDENTFAFMYVLYRRNDPNCCPTGGGKIVRFRIEDGHVKALDKLPPRQLGTIPVGR